MKVVRLSALGTGRLTPRKYSRYSFLLEAEWLSQLQGHSAAGRIMSMKNSNDTIENRTRDLSACSAVSQPTAPLRTALLHLYFPKILPNSIPAVEQELLTSCLLWW